MIYTAMIKKAVNILYEKQKDKKDIFGYPLFIHAFSVAENMSDETLTIIALLFGAKEKLNYNDLKKEGFSEEIINALSYLVKDETQSYDSYIKKIIGNSMALDVMISFLYNDIDYMQKNDIDRKFINETERKRDYLNYLINYKMHKKRDVYKDSIFGFVVGDALGVPLECTPRVVLQQNPVGDMIGFRTHMMPPGTWSDDTSMTLAEMDSISETKKIDYFDIMNKFVAWNENNDYTSTGVCFDIGNTTKKALIKFNNGNIPLECGGNSINDNGNGSLMRMLPFIIYSNEKKLLEEEEVELINNSSSITHSHEISKLGCKIYCDFIKCLYNGKNIEETFIEINNINYAKYYSLETINMYKRILDGSVRFLKKNEINSHGYIISTLEASLWSLYNSNDFSSAVLNAINLGGDTDTIGAITGSLAGAYYGMIPTKWLEMISNIDLVDFLYDSYIESLNKDYSLEIKK